MKPACPVREIARWVKGMGWTRASRPVKATRMLQDGNGGASPPSLAKLKGSLRSACNGKGVGNRYARVRM